MSLGLDSLMAIEIRNQISAGLGVTIAVTQLMDNLSMAGLARLVGEQIATRQLDADDKPAAVGAADAEDAQTAEIEVRI